LLALSFQARSWTEVFELLLIWLLVIVAGSTTSFLIAQAAKRKGVKPWTH
jgi:multisubunit Na+/H+ antiporter MnhG subunit